MKRRKKIRILLIPLLQLWLEANLFCNHSMLHNSSFGHHSPLSPKVTLYLSALPILYDFLHSILTLCFIVLFLGVSFNVAPPPLFHFFHFFRSTSSVVHTEYLSALQLWETQRVSYRRGTQGCWAEADLAEVVD